MREIEAQLWEVGADLRVITTNGMLRQTDGACVMGRGCAREARDRFPGIDVALGRLIIAYGNRVVRLPKQFSHGGARICSFPVKHHYRESADPDLIRRSAGQLVALADKFGYPRVVIPRSGCGNGKLKWADVRPVLAGILDERFTLVTYPRRRPS